MDERRLLSLRLRLALAGMSFVGVMLLFTAWRLSPDPRGYGTHEQLGLAPCAFYVWTGWKCPSCGMTTAWAHAMHGNLPAALHANAAGTLLCGFVGATTVWAAASAVMGTWFVTRPSPRWLLGIGSAWLMIAVLDWARRLAIG